MESFMINAGLIADNYRLVGSVGYGDLNRKN